MSAPARPGRIAILAPMPSELAPIRRILALQPSVADGMALHRGRIRSTELVAATTGIGTQAAAQATERLLHTVPVEHVMVVGIAGGIGPSQVGDVIRPRVVVDRATGREYRPSALRDVPEQGTLATSDELLVDAATIAALVSEGVIALDMETAAVAARCEDLGCPWSVVRAISDRADGHADDAVLGLARPDGSPDLPAVARFLLTQPWRLPELTRLARDARAAATAAARACARQLD